MNRNKYLKDGPEDKLLRDEITRILDDLARARGIDVDRLRRETRDEIDRYERYRRNDPLIR